MEMQLLEDLNCWDPTEDLLFAGDLFTSPLNNWEEELGLGTKSFKSDPVDGRDNLSGNALPCINLLDGLDASLDGLLEDWMEIKVDVENCNLENTTLSCLTTLLDSTDVPVTCDVDASELKTEAAQPNICTTEVSAPDELVSGISLPDSPCSLQEEPTVKLKEQFVPVYYCETELVTPPVSPPRNTAEIETDSTDSSCTTSPSSPPPRKRKPYNRKRAQSARPRAEPKTVVCNGNKKLRKRDQNRDAATRYRLKKRAESEAIGQQQADLEATNKGLKDRVESLSSEIKYLKGLLKELFFAKK